MAIAPTTRRTYSTGERRYLSFCKLSSWIPLPASDIMLSSFAAFLARTVRPGTVAVYVASVRNLHIELGLPDPTSAATLLPRVLRGIQRSGADVPSPTRLPITMPILRQLINISTSDPARSYRDRLMLNAAMLLSFYGLLRCSELVGGDNTPHLRRSSITWQNYEGRKAMTIRLAKSKTDPNGHGVDIHIGPAIPPYCAVSALLAYLVASPADSSADSPLLTRQCGRPLTRQFFTDEVRRLLLQTGVSTAGHYASHSFRIGAASSAAMANVPEWLIRSMGRWRSDCVLRYIRRSVADELAVADKLSGSEANVRVT